ncbi:MAG: Flp family type IVb pilin [Alphaproteobacteria bacterium]
MYIRNHKDSLQTIRTLLNDNSGTTAIEYGLIGTLISIVIISSVESIGTSSANNVFGAITGILR